MSKTKIIEKINYYYLVSTSKYYCKRRRIKLCFCLKVAIYHIYSKNISACMPVVCQNANGYDHEIFDKACSKKCRRKQGFYSFWTGSLWHGAQWHHYQQYLNRHDYVCECNAEFIWFY